MIFGKYLSDICVKTLLIFVDTVHIIQDVYHNYLKPFYKNQIMPVLVDHTTILLNEDLVDKCYLIYDGDSIYTYSLYNCTKQELLKLLNNNVVIFSFLLNDDIEYDNKEKRRYVILNQTTLFEYFEDVVYNGRVYSKPNITKMRNSIQTPFMFVELNKHQDIYKEIRKYFISGNCLTPRWFEYFMKHHYNQSHSIYEIHFVNNHCKEGYWSQKQWCKIQNDGRYTIQEYDINEK